MSVRALEALLKRGGEVAGRFSLDRADQAAACFKALRDEVKAGRLGQGDAEEVERLAAALKSFVASLQAAGFGDSGWEARWGAANQRGGQEWQRG